MPEMHQNSLDMQAKHSPTPLNIVGFGRPLPGFFFVWSHEEGKCYMLIHTCMGFALHAHATVHADISPVCGQILESARLFGVVQFLSLFLVCGTSMVC